MKIAENGNFEKRLTKNRISRNFFFCRTTTFSMSHTTTVTQPNILSHHDPVLGRIMKIFSSALIAKAATRRKVSGFPRYSTMAIKTKEKKNTLLKYPSFPPFVFLSSSLTSAARYR